MWATRAARHMDGLVYPGGPDDQPHMLMLVVGWMSHEDTLCRAKDAMAAKKLAESRR